MDKNASKREAHLAGKAAGQVSEQIGPDLERKLNLAVLVFILIMLLCVIVIPGSWFDSASMWCGEHLPGF